MHIHMLMNLRIQDLSSSLLLMLPGLSAELDWWIGLTDTGHEGSWLWVSEFLFSGQNWEFRSDDTWLSLPIPKASWKLLPKKRTIILPNEKVREAEFAEEQFWGVPPDSSEGNHADCALLSRHDTFVLYFWFIIYDLLFIIYLLWFMIYDLGLCYH